MTRYYCIGGLNFALTGPPFEESSFLAPFRCEPCLPEIDFTVELGHPTLPEGRQSPIKTTLHTREYSLQGRQLLVMYQEHSDKLLLSREEIAPGRYHICLERACLELYDNNLVLKLLDLPELLIKKSAVFLHASFVEYEGQAILFTAPKQTGKSTQASLWRMYRNAQIVNGDRALLRRVKGRWMAYGSPYCGTSDICKNAAYPLRAIVLLRQGKENQVRKASPSEVAAAFLDGCTFDPEVQTETILDLALDLSQAVPVLHFSCLPDASAVDCLAAALTGLSS